MFSCAAIAPLFQYVLETGFDFTRLASIPITAASTIMHALLAVRSFVKARRQRAAEIQQPLLSHSIERQFGKL